MAVNQQKLLGKTTSVQSTKVAPQQQLIAAPADTAALQDISKSLTRILQLLTQQNTQVTNEANQERKNQEVARRKKIELGLEGSFAVVKNAAQAIVAPVKNILDQIIQFFVTLFLGKALLNLINWFANPENQSKVRSIARFLRDWWPSLIAGYILFGTGFGRAVRSLVGIAARSVMLLGGVALKLTGAIARAIGLKKAGTALSALGSGGGGLKGILAKLVVGGAVAAGGAVIAKNMMGGGEEETPQLDVPPAPALPIAEAFGGGLIDFKTMLAASGGQVDSKLGILTQLFGSGGFASLLHGVPGVVSGPKGIDKVPAMLTDGEFVMSRGAVQKFGVNTLESMNAAGGGTNRPKIVNRKIYAEGGGFIGKASHHIKEDEALSSLTKGENDFIKPGGQSVLSSKPWSSVKSNTPLYSYGDKYKIPTIGWGSTYYDSILNGKNPVKSGDSITRSRADSILNVNILNLAKEYSKKIPTWNKMSDNQKAGILLVGYNAPNGPIGAYPNLTDALKTGNMLSAAEHAVKRRGPSASRLSLEKKLILDGPKNLSKVNVQKTDSKPKEKTKSSGLLDNIFGGINKFIFGDKKSNLPAFFGGGLVRGKEGIDNVPAMLTRNEFVMSPGAVQEFGVNTLESMNAAGGGTNRPKNATPRRFNESVKSISSANIVKTPPKQKPITPTPKPAPKVISRPPVAGGGMGGARGGGAKPFIPSLPAGKSNSKTAKQLGIK